MAVWGSGVRVPLAPEQLWQGIELGFPRRRPENLPIRDDPARYAKYAARWKKTAGEAEV